jgi:hypothetical protein
MTNQDSPVMLWDEEVAGSNPVSPTISSLTTTSEAGVHAMSGGRDMDAHQSLRRSAPRDTSVFDRNVDGLVDAKPPAPAELKTGEAYDFRAGPVRKRIRDATVKMLAYNGSIPGPLLRTTQDAEVIVEFQNEMDVETTVHWHGLRHENFYDGVPRGLHAGVQAPVPPGGRFSYRLRFPDPGIFWYHPHIREDYQQRARFVRHHRRGAGRSGVLVAGEPGSRVDARRHPDGGQ